MNVHIDIETYSDVDIEAGVYKYVESENFEILIISAAAEDEPVRTYSIRDNTVSDHHKKVKEILPGQFYDWVNDPGVTFWAHNAAFERMALKAVGIDIPLDRWKCTMIMASQCGLPLSLRGASEATELQHQKDRSGTLLINYFSKPCKATRTNNGRTRNYPGHHTEKWEMFKRYCAQDVETERDLYRTLQGYTQPLWERDAYIMSERINDTGVLTDLDFAEKCSKLYVLHKSEVLKDTKVLTGVENPNSLAQLKSWLSEKTGEVVTGLAASDIKRMMKEDYPQDVLKVLSNRSEVSKTSVKKYDAMIKSTNMDGRCRGLFQHGGASRTGRYAGRRVQLQNLPRNYINDLAGARQDVMNEDYATICDWWEEGDFRISHLLSELIRTSFIAPEGKVLAIADFSAIEARVLAWLASEKWRLEAFENGRDIYRESYSKMFGVPYEEVTKVNGRRALGKVAELALGYQGGVGAMRTFGAHKFMTDLEMSEVKHSWRAQSPNIEKFWHDLDSAAQKSVSAKNQTIALGNLVFLCDERCMRLRLPSGRKLTYWGPRIVDGKFGPKLVYQGATSTGQWGVVDTYGGKLCENVTQAVARDLMVLAMMRLQHKGFKIVMHIHDEAVCEVDRDVAEEKLQEMIKVMNILPDWAEGLPLDTDGFLSPYYMKD